MIPSNRLDELNFGEQNPLQISKEKGFIRKNGFLPSNSKFTSSLILNIVKENPIKQKSFLAVLELVSEEI